MNINFLHPEMLFAMGFIAVPIIVHLFNFRKFKKVYFTNVRFLKEITIQTQSRSKLKHLLVLISRILAIVCIVFAFAQPYIPLENNVQNELEAVNIYIDNSFSMSSMGRTGQLLEDAKKKAKEIISVHHETNRFKILTNDFEAQHRHSLTTQQAIDVVNETKISPSTKSIHEITSRQKGLSRIKSITYIISDFQKSSFSLSSFNKDTSLFYLIPLQGEKQSNIFIDSCWLSSPVTQLNVPNELVVKLGNSSKKDIENVPVKLTINNKTKAVSSVNIPASSSIIIKLPFSISEGGIQKAALSIVDDPVTFDDNYFFSLKVSEKIKVLAIESEENKYLNALFLNESLFDFQKVDINKIDYSSLPENNLLVLNGLKSIPSGLVQELKKYLTGGGNILLIPGTEIDFDSYSSVAQNLNFRAYSTLNTSESKVKNIELENDLFKGVFEKGKETKDNIDLPKVKKYFELNKTKLLKEEILLKLETGSIFLDKFSSGNGNIYVFTTPFNKEYTNFVEHALFVPIIYKIAFSSIKSDIKFYTIGKDEPIELQNKKSISENSAHITNSEKFDIIPEIRNIGDKTYLYQNNTIKTSGFYDLKVDGKVENVLSYNYDRKESQLETYTAAELKDQIETLKLKNIKVLETGNKELKKEIEEISSGVRLWKWALILGLLFLTLEVLLLKFLK